MTFIAKSKPSMNPALKDFWATPARQKILYGGRTSSKTLDAGANLIRISNTVKVRVLCTRMFQNKLEESVYTVLQEQAERFGLTNNFIFTRNNIVNKVTGSEFLFYGISRNIEEIRSFQGADILWIEEAHFLTKKAWDILEPTIRAEGSEIWIIFNPMFATDFVFKNFVKEEENRIIRKINYNENPFLSETIKKVIEKKRLENEEDFNHIYLGVPLESDTASIIKAEWIYSCIDSHIILKIEQNETKVVGFDVANDGGDLNAIAYRKGCVLEYIEEWKGQKDGLLQSISRVYDFAEKNNAQIIYDCIGVGASVGGKIKELNEKTNQEIRFSTFDAGKGVENPFQIYENKKNKDHFLNLKAQAWFTIADRMRKTHEYVKHGNKCDNIISISSNLNIDSLLLELTAPRLEYSGDRLLRVESKKDMAKRGVKSPNVADAFIMCFYQAKKYHDYSELL